MNYFYSLNNSHLPFHRSSFIPITPDLPRCSCKCTTPILHYSLQHFPPPAAEHNSHSQHSRHEGIKASTLTPHSLVRPAMSNILLCVLLPMLTLTMGEYQSSCETLLSKIHITKVEYGKGKEMLRSCEDDIELNKCEGYCVSTTQPSAMER